VDVGDAKDDLPEACSNCGVSDASRRRRMFIEPKGFVTSAAESQGKDPGTSRRRVKPADEARLIAAPRADQFVETELSFLSTSLLLARGSGDSSLTGSLFVANRGMYGEGYYRCLTCNYCEAVLPKAKPSAKAKKLGGAGSASSPESKKFLHKDPSSGSQCKSDFMPKMGIDFAHLFNTDVRLLRFLAPLPLPSEEGQNERNFQERVARTVAEACRLSATDLLRLQPGEIRSTYRLYTDAGSIVEVVLYDGVPGGAGYCARLGNPLFGFRAFIEGVAKRLTCSQNCDTACRACLCDYGNQRHWDSFVRKEALQWVEALLGGKLSVDGPGNYVPWHKPSLSGLAERVAAAPVVKLVGTSLSGPAYQETELNQILAWLQSGKTVELYVLNKLDGKPKDYATLMLYRHLYPWVHSKKLKVFGLERTDGRVLGVLPRCITSTDDGALLIRQAFPVQPLLDGLISGPAELGAMDEETRKLVDSALNTASLYEASHFAEGQSMAMWEFPSGAPRLLADVFKAVEGAHVKKLVIRDPYCGVAHHRPKLQTLLEHFKKSTSAIEKAEVYCSEVKQRERDGSEYMEHRFAVAQAVEKIMDELGIEKNEAFVKELGRNRTFHDRELTLEVTDATGCDSTHRYFLTGGIDYLLDERSDTKVFHAVLDN
jgi:hypothetical protein